MLIKLSFDVYVYKFHNVIIATLISNCSLKQKAKLKLGFSIGEEFDEREKNFLREQWEHETEIREQYAMRQSVEREREMKKVEEKKNWDNLGN